MTKQYFFESNFSLKNMFICRIAIKRYGTQWLKEFERLFTSGETSRLSEISYLSEILVVWCISLSKNKLFISEWIHPFQVRVVLSGVVACTCNPATLDAEFRNGVGSISVGGNGLLIGGWTVWQPVIQLKERSFTKYWDLDET